jgi:hypothetical protein
MYVYSLYKLQLQVLFWVSWYVFGAPTPWDGNLKSRPISANVKNPANLAPLLKKSTQSGEIRQFFHHNVIYHARDYLKNVTSWNLSGAIQLDTSDASIYV